MSGAQERLDAFSEERGARRMVRDYLEFLGGIIGPQARVLDAGCGERGAYSASALNRAGLRQALVGIDLGMAPNPHVDQKHVGDLARLPFADASFDAVLCEWVAEHAEQPARMMAEFARVLRPGGHAVFITANRRNPLVLFGWLIPTGLKDFLLNRLLGQQESDLFPLHMRFNERADMSRIAEASGCAETLFRTYPNPEYFRWSDFVLTLALWWQDRLRDARWAEPYAMYILAAYKKG